MSRNNSPSRPAGPWAGAIDRAFARGRPVVAMAILLGLPATLGAGGSPGPVLPPPPADAAAALRPGLDDIFDHPRFAAAGVGVVVVSLDTGRVLFGRDARKLLKPASNNKLYSGALFLDRLGPAGTVRTSVYARAAPGAGGAVEGDLVIYGRGDPSFAARFNGGDHSLSLVPLADAIAAAGVERVAGDLVGDTTFFQGPPGGHGWTWDDLQYYYGAEASALSVNDNVLDFFLRPGLAAGDAVTFEPHPPTHPLRLVNRLRTAAEGAAARVRVHRPVGAATVYLTGQLPAGGESVEEAVTVPSPARWFLQLLREELAARGITVEGRDVVRRWPEEVDPFDTRGWTEIAAAESRPVAELLEKMMKPSQNLYAQLFLLHVGALDRGEGRAVDGTGGGAESSAIPPTTESVGLDAMATFLKRHGIDPREVRLEEGSGLSRGTLLTPAATLALLQEMAGHPHEEAFRASLPAAGVDGTLRRRLRGTAAEGVVRAKTGSLRFVSALSGYADSAAGERLAFSALINAFGGPPTEARGALDQLALALVGCEVRSDAGGPPDFSAAEKVLERAVSDGAFPGCAVAVGTSEEVLWSRGFGRLTYAEDAAAVTPETIYDLASLTKVVATTSVCLRLAAAGKLSVDDPLVRHLPEFVEQAPGEADTAERTRRGAVTLRHLLTHSAGLVAWKPFYKKVTSYPELLREVIATPMEREPGERYRYSDLGYILLGEALSRAGGKPLPELEKELLIAPLGLATTRRNPPADWRSRIAPTERDPDTRDGGSGDGADRAGEVGAPEVFIHGEVHDENSRFAGGVTGHAGLFSNAVDLSRFAREILRARRGQSEIFPRRWAEAFTRPQVLPGTARRTLGWALTSPRSSSGSELSHDAFGHTGFTGTSIWFDPRRDLFVLLLANRVHPTRENTKIFKVRRDLADAVARAFDGRPTGVE